MITITTERKSFIVYKTGIKGDKIDATYTIKVQNNISKKMIVCEFDIVELINSYIITINTDVSKLKEKCTVFIYNTTEECIYKEIAMIKNDL